MPIQFETPVERAPIEIGEVTGFYVDLRENTLQVRLAEMTKSGEVVKEYQLPETLALYYSNGQPRFTPSEYISIKSAIYRMLLEDGIVTGNVV